MARPLHVAPQYTARHGIVWTGDTIPNTVSDATQAAHDLLDHALTELDPAYSAEWVSHLGPLVAAIREAKQQEAEAPVHAELDAWEAQVEAPALSPVIADILSAFMPDALRQAQSIERAA